MADTNQSPVPTRDLPGDELPQEEKFYFNGFTLSLTPTDVMIGFMREGNVIQVGTTSYTTVKSLAVQLNTVLDILENKIGLKVLTYEEMAAAISKQMGSQ